LGKQFSNSQAISLLPIFFFISAISFSTAGLLNFRWLSQPSPPGNHFAIGK
jgi:hypothetical protein